ncbi:carbohydrate ABC transporter permease [Streptomyces sp. NPDC058656]|uniref:carbohydrate ABC transporter permease n=1 Tax=unclassified Streptomyces TaxID=2593676 RepID=UPI0036498DFB
MITRYTWRTLVLEAALWAIAAISIAVPLWILISVALKRPQDVSTGLTFPNPVNWSNFTTAWTQGSLDTAFLTSVLITVTTVLFSVVTSALAAYPLARVTRTWSKLVFGLFLAGLIIPSALGVLPLYITMVKAGFVGNVAAVILIYVGQTVSFNVFLYVAFLRALPRDYEEAAVIDGCGPVRTYWSIVFPLLRPVTGTIVVLNVISVYNDFFTPLLYLNGSANATLPLALRNFSSTYFTNYGAIFAGLIVALVPVLLFYFLLQKKIISGFAGGLKG